MAKVLYLNQDGTLPVLNWHGIVFQHGQEVELDDIRDAEVIAAAEADPHFTVSGRRYSVASADPPAGNTQDDVARQHAIHTGGSKPDDSAKQHDENDTHNRMAGENVGMRSQTNPTQT